MMHQTEKRLLRSVAPVAIIVVCMVLGVHLIDSSAGDKSLNSGRILSSEAVSFPLRPLLPDDLDSIETVSIELSLQAERIDQSKPATIAVSVLCEASCVEGPFSKEIGFFALFPTLRVGQSRALSIPIPARLLLSKGATISVKLSPAIEGRDVGTTAYRILSVRALPLSDEASSE